MNKTAKKRTVATRMAALLTAAFLLTGCGAAAKSNPLSPTDVSSEASESDATLRPANMNDYVRLHSEIKPVFDGTYRSQLIEAEQAIYDGLVQNIIVERRTDEVLIDYSSVKQDVDWWFLKHEIMMTAFWAFYEDYPEAGGVMYFTSIKIMKDDKIDAIKMNFRELFNNTFEELNTVMDNVDKAVEKIRETRASESRYDTAKAIHNYICANAAYDYEAWYGDNIEYKENASYAIPLFGGGCRGSQFVCSGYAYAFKLLCARLGVPCYRICGDTPLGWHAWNFVQMDDGKWYGVDVTWDDIGNASQIIYDYFLSGKNTVTHNVKFSEDHIPDVGPYLTYVTRADDSSIPDDYNPCVYPEQTDERYEPAA